MWYYFDLVYPAYCLAVGLLAQGALSSLPGHLPGESGRLWRRLALGSLVAAIVVIQAWSLVGLVQTVHRTGVLSLPSTILLNFIDPEHRSMETMPLRHKRALAEHFWRDFGADHSLLEARAHGAYLWVVSIPLYTIFPCVTPYRRRSSQVGLCRLGLRRS